MEEWLKIIKSQDVDEAGVFDMIHRESDTAIYLVYFVVKQTITGHTSHQQWHHKQCKYGNVCHKFLTILQIEKLLDVLLYYQNNSNLSNNEIYNTLLLRKDFSKDAIDSVISKLQ